MVQTNSRCLEQGATLRSAPLRPHGRRSPPPPYFRRPNCCAGQPTTRPIALPSRYSTGTRGATPMSDSKCTKNNRNTTKQRAESRAERIELLLCTLDTLVLQVLHWAAAVDHLTQPVLGLCAHTFFATNGAAAVRV